MRGGFAWRAGGLVAIAAAIAIAAAMLMRPETGTGSADPSDATQVNLGRAAYAAECASCHGVNLEGQPNWRQRLPNGRLPAPPHDASGHTWHHPDRVLFEITRDGIAAHAPPGYESDMPAFGGRLSDVDIWAVLAFIKSTWPADIRARQDRLSQLPSGS